MIGSLNVIISRAIGRSPFAHSDFAWIAMLFDEFFALSVRADSPIGGGRDLVARLLKDPGALTIGVSTSIGGANHLSAALALHRAGVDPKRVKFVAFKGGADSITALLGGHIDAAATAVSAAVPHMRNAQLRTIAVSSPQRLGGALAALPTWAERGINGTMTNFRAVIAPRGTAAVPVAFWKRRFAQLAKPRNGKPSWKAACGRGISWTAQKPSPRSLPMPRMSTRWSIPWTCAKRPDPVQAAAGVSRHTAANCSGVTMRNGSG